MKFFVLIFLFFFLPFFLLNFPLFIGASNVAELRERLSRDFNVVEDAGLQWPNDRNVLCCSATPSFFFIFFLFYRQLSHHCSCPPARVRPCFLIFHHCSHPPIHDFASCVHPALCFKGFFSVTRKYRKIMRKS